MKFFIPDTPDEVLAEQIYDGIVSFAQDNFGKTPSSRRIFSLTFFDKGEVVTAEVGKITVNQELVIAILDIGTYLICTPSQGVLRGIPAMVGLDEVIEVADFD